MMTTCTASTPATEEVDLDLFSEGVDLNAPLPLPTQADEMALDQWLAEFGE